SATLSEISFAQRLNWFYERNTRRGCEAPQSIEVLGRGPNVVSHRGGMGRNIKPVPAFHVVSNSKCVKSGQHTMHKRGEILYVLFSPERNFHRLLPPPSPALCNPPLGALPTGCADFILLPHSAGIVQR